MILNTGSDGDYGSNWEIAAAQKVCYNLKCARAPRNDGNPGLAMTVTLGLAMTVALGMAISSLQSRINEDG